MKAKIDKSDETVNHIRKLVPKEYKSESYLVEIGIQV